ncbi:MAG: P-loop NTPase [Spirochaetales bacterium]|nr:P-loop NTPase [Spirochaetales bacterium]
MNSVIFGNSFGFTSGKGGVGKTTTSVNYAIALVKDGYKVGLLDLDPLSNIATLLDIEIPDTPYVGDMSKGLSSYTHTVFRKLDVLFYSRKTETDASRTLASRLTEEFHDKLSKNYDYLIFDLPAGIDEEENIIFARMVKSLVIVTNPEPTAHVAAGAYIKRILELDPGMTVMLWHNRYSSVSTQHFDSSDVIANYNRNMPEEDRIIGDINVRHIGYVPSDPSLDLLHGAPSVTIQAQRSMENLFRIISEERLYELIIGCGWKGKSAELLRFYFTTILSKKIKLEDFLDGYGSYLRLLLTDKLNLTTSLKMFNEEEREQLKRVYETVFNDQLLQQITLTQTLCRHNIQALYDSEHQFSAISSTLRHKEFEREVVKLLILLSRIGNESQRTHGGILVFYTALFKLFHSDTLVALLHNFIPHVKDSRGKLKRDRYRQIRYLVEHTEAYRKKYLGLIKQLMPVVTKQINTIITTFELQGLLLKDKKGDIAKDAYVRLLSNFFHDTIYSGLSVIIGFSYRSAAIEFEKAYKSLLNEHRRTAA